MPSTATGKTENPRKRQRIWRDLGRWLQWQGQLWSDLQRVQRGLDGLD